MNRYFKWLAISTVVVVILVATGITATVGWRPILGPKQRPVTDRKFEATPARLARGKYLVTSTAGCFGCHSEHDWKSHGAPFVAGMMGAGEVMPFAGLPGRVVAPNLTSDPETGIGAWTDDELARAIREGIGRDGRALFPMMPYEKFRNMCDEDLASVIVFLRTLQPVRRQLPRTEIVFPVKYLMRSAPQPVTQPVSSERAMSPDPVKRGSYLVTIGGCAECHTPQYHGQPVAGMELAGGFQLTGPWGTVASANITPDDSGIKYYDEALFLQAIRTGYVRARELKPIMPYWDYAGMTDDDLKAVFAYLKTVKPVKHRVDNGESISECKICRQKHGAGEDN
jgi:mono/diheme cytochrome c family protein